jgi:ATP-dependent DNA helicase PIF1
VPLTFCFEGNAWSKCMLETVELRQIFRQSNQDFIKMLDEIRVGSCTEKSLTLLQKCKQDKNSSTADEDGILPTMLYAKNIQVDDINKKQLDSLTGIHS